jgi:hypothetical protein
MDRAALRQLLVLANEHKEGDEALGGTRDAAVRAEARAQLGRLRLGELWREPIVEDEMS